MSEQTAVTNVARVSPIDALRAEFLEFAETLKIEDKARDATLSFILEKTRKAWFSGKEFGWKKAWNWKRRNTTEEQSAD